MSATRSTVHTQFKFATIYRAKTGAQQHQTGCESGMRDSERERERDGLDRSPFDGIPLLLQPITHQPDTKRKGRQKNSTLIRQGVATTPKGPSHKNIKIQPLALGS